MIRLTSLLNESAANSYAKKYMDPILSFPVPRNSEYIIGSEFIDTKLYSDPGTDTRKKRELIQQIFDSKKADIFKLIDTTFAGVGFKSVSLTYENSSVVVKSAGEDHFQYSEDLLSITGNPVRILEYSNPTTGNSAKYVASKWMWYSVHIIRNYDRVWNYKLIVDRDVEIFAQKKSGGQWTMVHDGSKPYDAIYNKVYAAQFGEYDIYNGNSTTRGEWRKRANNMDPNYEYSIYSGPNGTLFVARARNIKTDEKFDLIKLADKNPKYQKTIDIIVKEWPTMVKS